MKLSAHFDSHEFACPCCRRDAVDPRLVAALEDLRAIVMRPIIVASGFRCPGHNRAVGGARNSYHLRGQAADIRVPELTPAAVATAVRAVAALRGIGAYAGHTHVDVRERRYSWTG
ncbi:MAG: DUF882 domain-containing protein [Bryobacteraceae bacterium]|nr:DUF882 domain-containing protein [Bryobacteraceae bacterium]